MRKLLIRGYRPFEIFFLEVIFFIHKNNKIKMKLILHETLFCTSRSIISNLKQVSITKITKFIFRNK